MQWSALDTSILLRRLGLYLLPAGIVLCTFAGRSPARALADETAAVPSAVISEVMWMGTDLSTADEWLEIACVGSQACDLSGWTLKSLKSTGEHEVILLFATGASLPAGDARVISHYPASSSRLALEPWIVSSSFTLPNTKLLLQLCDAAGTVREQADDGVGNPFAGSNPSGGPKASMERIDLLVSGSDPANWRTTTLSSGFKEGVPIFGTPGVLPLVFAPSSSSSSSSAGGASSDISSAGAFSSSQEEFSMSGSSISSESSSSSSGSSLLSSQASLTSSISPALPTVLLTEVLSNPIGADTEEWIEIGNLGAQAVNIAGWVLDDGNSTAVYAIPPRGDGGFVLAAGEHVSFRKSVTGLSLDNSGERVSLMNGPVLADAWEYPLTAEEVSYGRDPEHPDQLHAFCVPTEGRPNSNSGLQPRILIQDAGNAEIGSAFVLGTEHVTLNLQAAVGAGSLASAVCAWDYGDDAVSSACNPPSHTLSDAGNYTVRLTVRDFCGSIAVSTLSVTVLAEEDSADTSSASSASSISSVSSAASVSSTSSSVAMMTPVRVETGVVLSEVNSVPVHTSSAGAGDILSEEWIELFNPTDHEISLGGWILDDAKHGGSKQFSLAVDTTIAAGAYRIFSKSETKLALNDAGDDVWLIAPDSSWSDGISVPKLKTGTSFALCLGQWRVTAPTPASSNACGVSMSMVAAASSSSALSTKAKRAGTSLQSFARTRYVVSSVARSGSSLGSARGDTAVSSDSSGSSGSLLMTYVASELPASLTVTGEAVEESAVPEAGALGAVSGLGIAMIWLGRRWMRF